MNPRHLIALAGSGAPNAHTPALGTPAPSWPMFARIHRDPEEEPTGGGEGGDGADLDPAPESAASAVEDAHDELLEDDTDEGKDDDEDAGQGEEQGEGEGGEEDEGGEAGEGAREGKRGKGKEGEDEPPSLSPEDEDLLRDSGAEDEELDAYRAMPEDQREKLLRPLRRRARQSADEGTPREDRGTGDRRPRTPARSETEPDPYHAEALKEVTEAIEKVAAEPVFDEKVLKELSEAEGLSVQGLQTLGKTMVSAVNQVLLKRLEPVLGLVAAVGAERKRSAAAVRHQRILQDAASYAQKQLAKSFPKLLDEKEIEAVIGDRRARATFSANVHGGMSARAAMLDAIKLVATARYLPDLQNSKQKQAEQQARRRTRGTAERAGGTRPGKPPAPRLTGPSSSRVDQAHATVLRGE